MIAHVIVTADQRLADRGGMLGDYERFVDSIDVTNASLVGASGCRAPAGGMSPPRTLRTTFSQISAEPATSSTLMLSSVSPAVLRRWLWHDVQ